MNEKKKNRKNQEEALRELFDDLYESRRKVYKLNFFRGIFFGAGSAVGGTVVVALVVWLLSLFVNFPLIGRLFENAQNTLEHSTEQTR